MPNLNSISLMINGYLQSGAFNSNRYQNGKYYGIADPIKTVVNDAEMMNYNYIDNNGEAESVVMDDRYPFVIFHRVMNISYKNADPEYGDSGETMEETADMRLVFFGQRLRMKTRPENVIAAIAMNIPKEFTATDISALQINSLVVEMGDVNHDPYQVWNDNFQGTEFALDTDTVGVAISYRIVSTFNKCCFSICN